VRVAPRTALALMLAIFSIAILRPATAGAQDDPNDQPLGDVARNLRQNKPSSQQVIDNDNMDKVMDEVQSHRLTGASLLYSMDGQSKNFQVSVPDATCSLSFTANAKALLSTQYVQLELPASELPKLEGPATIAGDALQVSVYNATDWHVSEVDVAVTIVRAAEATEVPESDASTNNVPASGVPAKDGAKLIPAAASAPMANPADVPKVAGNNSPKRSDITLVYKIRAAAPPSSVTVFSAPLNVAIAPGQEWHWAIVQAKGYPPQTTMLPDPQQAQNVAPATMTDSGPVLKPASQTVESSSPAAVPSAPDSSAH
jgi:hypothetical protein